MFACAHALHEFTCLLQAISVIGCREKAVNDCCLKCYRVLYVSCTCRGREHCVWGVDAAPCKNTTLIINSSVCVNDNNFLKTAVITLSTMCECGCLGNYTEHTACNMLPASMQVPRPAMHVGDNRRY